MQIHRHILNESNGIIKKYEGIYADPNKWVRQCLKKEVVLVSILSFQCSQIQFYRHQDCSLTGVIISHFTNRTHQLVYYQSTPRGGWVADYKMSTGHTQTKLIVNANLSCFLHLHKFQSKSCIKKINKNINFHSNFCSKWVNILHFGRCNWRCSLVSKKPGTR